MDYFEYKTRNRSTGKIFHGIITADDLESAEETLKRRGENIVEIGEMTDFLNIRKAFFSFSQKTGKKVRLEFFIMLKFMLESGMALYESLINIRDSGNSTGLKNLTKIIADEVRKGATLSLAMQKSGKFENSTVQQIKAGEESGKMNDTISRLITQMEREIRFKGKLKSAMIYPIIICIVMTIVLFVMMTVVVPSLAGTLISMGGELPLITRIVIGVSEFMKKATPFLIILIIAVTVGYRFGVRNKTFKLNADKAKLKIPIVGNMLEKIELSRFCTNLSAMQKSGITLVNSLRTVEAAVKNSKIENEIQKACSLVEISGMNLAAALSKAGDFPPLMLQLIEIGISSGQICDVLDKIANQYEKEVDENLKRVTSLLEPAMIIIVGIAAGIIVVSIMVPMFSLVDTIGA